MANGVLIDPLPNFNFLVELDGITTAAFNECTGFDSSVDVIERRSALLEWLQSSGRVEVSEAARRFEVFRLTLVDFGIWFSIVADAASDCLVARF